jgi:restriction system-associated AAA family ATPase
MKLERIRLLTQFNSLEPFENINISHIPNDEHKIDPLCLIGINGSGKSNLLELISEAFYFLEVNYRFLKDSSSKQRTLKQFEIVYSLNTINRAIKIESITSGLVKMHIENETWETEEDRWNEVTDVTDVLNYLPNKIIGYTSGMNETLSFRFNQLDDLYSQKVLENAKAKSKQRIKDNRMIFLDYESNEAILISNFLFKQPSELKVFDQLLRINGLSSFKIIINLERKKRSTKIPYVILSNELEEYLQKFSLCSTTRRINKHKKYYEFDFLVNEASKIAFKEHFGGIYNLFMAFQKFELLNPINLERKYRKTKTGEDIIEGRPTLAKNDRVFRFEDIYITISSPKREIQYLSISDGEHQFIQIIGAFMIFEQDNVLFLLDEPETHFNPSWRTKFINIINQYTKNRNQDIAITTHSPFVVSDCKDYRVFKFKRIKDKCFFEPIGIETYGTSFDIILKKAFDVENTISQKAKSEIDLLLESNDEKVIQEFIDNSGPSFEKLALLRHLKELNPDT